MKKFNVLDLAVAIEDSGAEFYSLAAKRINGDAAILFDKLSREEKDHAGVFKKLLKENSDSVIVESAAIRFASAAGRFVFNEIKLENEIKAITSVEDALSFAMRRELDTILLYEEIAKAVTGGLKSIFKEIAEVERGHFFKLADENEKVKGG